MTETFRSPPGYPLAYREERWRITCGGCGNVTTFSLLMVCIRSGSDKASFSRTGASEVIYDLPTDHTGINMGTARCQRCIDTLPREPVDFLPPRQTNPVGRNTLALEASAKRPKAARSLDDFDFS